MYSCHTLWFPQQALDSTVWHNVNGLQLREIPMDLKVKTVASNTPVSTSKIQARGGKRDGRGGGGGEGGRGW